MSIFSEREKTNKIWYSEKNSLHNVIAKLTAKNGISGWGQLSRDLTEAKKYAELLKGRPFNGRELGIFESPCDCGGVRGALTLSWFSVLSTQYGFLKTWRVDECGTYIDGVRINELTISDISFSDFSYISVKIGVARDANHVGGINLFGDKFGNYPQQLVLKVGYLLDKC